MCYLYWVVLVTARVRSTYDGRLCFHRYVSVQLWGGGWYPISSLDRGGTPSQVWTRGGGTPSQVQVGGTHPRSGWGDTPSQVWSGGYPILLMGGTPPFRPGMGGFLGYPPSKIGWGTPIQTWDGGTPGTPPHRRLDGVPPCPDLGQGGTPPPNQQNEHLLRGRRCASCVHAGGLSCISLLCSLVAQYKCTLRLRTY